MWIIRQEPRWLTATCLPQDKKRKLIQNLERGGISTHMAITKKGYISLGIGSLILSFLSSPPLCGGSVSHPETMNGYWRRINKIEPSVWWRKTEHHKKSKRHDWQFNFHTVLRPGRPLGREQMRLSVFWGETLGPLMDNELGGSIDLQRAAGTPPLSHRWETKHILCL